MATQANKLFIGACVLFIIIVFLMLYERAPRISFDPERKEIYVLTGTFLKTEKRELRSVDNKWYSIEPRHGLPVELATPFSMYYNQSYKIVLEPGGTLALVSNNQLERAELKWIDDQWKHKDPSASEWLEFGEYEPPGHEDSH